MSFVYIKASRKRPVTTASVKVVAGELRNPDLVIRDEDGTVMNVRHEAVNAMLLNEFLKEYRRVQEQQATIAL